MNKDIFKKIRDNMPEFLKYISFYLFRYKLIKNYNYVFQANQLDNRNLLNKSEIDNFQFSALKNILVYANNFVPFYTELFKNIKFDPNKMKTINEIELIPFLTKDIIRQNFDKLISTKVVPGGHYVATTGGTSGEPLKVLLDYYSVYQENAFINHFRGKLGYKLRDKLATFRGIEFGEKLWKFNPMQNEVVFSPFKLSEIKIKDYFKKLNEYKPAYLNGYLSSIYFLAKLLNSNELNFNFQLKGIFLISENIDFDQRNFIETFFKVKSLTFYGHSERCVIAEEVKLNEYNFDPYYGFTEFVKSNENNFEIVGTGFLNKTMPLIRYKTGDLCYKNDRNFKIIGRWKSNIGLYGLNGEFFTHAAFNFHSEIFKNVTCYQFFQYAKGKVNLLLLVNKYFMMDELKLIQDEIYKKTKGVIQFDIKVVDKLNLTKRGKFEFFINEIVND
jgi:phenylacetate-CoA ligase